MDDKPVIPQKKKISGKRMLFTIVLNSIITVSQLIGGVISGSLALISDAIHNLTDVISLIISYVANSLSHKKKQTTEKTFGYKRAEIIAAFFNSATLIVIAIFLGYESVHRFQNPVVIDSNIVIVLAFVAILANGLSVLLLKSDASDNLNIKSAYLHLLIDMLTSVAVLVGGILMKYFEIYWIDAVLTIVISIYLLYMSWDIFISSLKILMLFAPKHITIDEIQEMVLKEFDEIRNIHHVHIWQLNDYDIHLDAHLEFKKDIKLSEFDVVCKKIEEMLEREFQINHCFLQPEFDREDDKVFIIQD